MRYLFAVLALVLGVQAGIGLRMPVSWPQVGGGATAAAAG